MAILKNGEFDIDAFRKGRSKSSAKKDLVAELMQIAPEIKDMKVGETCVIENVKKEDMRSRVMQITAKLSHLTARGGDWAGKVYETASNADEGVIYVQRMSGTSPDKAPVRRKGGGRPSAEEKAAREAAEKAEAEAAENAENETNESEETEETTSEAEDNVTVTEHA